MKIAYIDKKNCTLEVKSKLLKVDEQKIPLRLIDTLVLAKSSHISSSDLVKLTKEGISILMLSSRGRDIAIVQSASSQNAQLKLAQYNAQYKALEVAKKLITQKVKLHTVQLQKHNIELEISELLAQIESVTSVESLLGIEGSFSKLYFSHYFSLFLKRLHQGKRSKNPPEDPLNAMMSFVYMMVYNLITVRLLSYGFEPSIGFLHKPFRSHNALSSDLMELFRADINEFVWTLFSSEQLKSSDFSKKNGVYLKYSSRREIWSNFKEFMQKLEPNIDKEIGYIRALL